MSAKREVEYRDGLRLKDSVLWFDAPRAKPLTFISHAQTPKAYLHQEILTTETTATLLKARSEAQGRGRRVHEPRALFTPYGRPFALGQLTLTLIPAGHVLGSASILVQQKTRRTLYAGTISPRPNAMVEGLEVRPCDTLVLPLPYGASRSHALPPPQGEREALVDFARDCLESGATPLIFLPPLGEAQEVLALLKDANLAVSMHRQIHALTKVYAERALASLSLAGVRRFTGTAREGDRVLLWPLHLWRSASLKGLKNVRRALVTDLVIRADVPLDLQHEKSFSFGNTADYGDVLDYVRAVEPAEVCLCGPNVSDLIEDLGAMGLETFQVGNQEQLPLFAR